MLAAILAVAALAIAATVVVYIMSGKVEVGRQGMIERLRRFIPVHSVKIVIVAWQIVTQVSVGGRIGWVSAPSCSLLDGFWSTTTFVRCQRLNFAAMMEVVEAL